MLQPKKSETIELECPECGALIRVTTEQAESGAVRCPRGHEVALMGIMGPAMSAATGRPPR